MRSLESIKTSESQAMIFSVYQSKESLLVNQYRHEVIKDVLKARNIDFVETVGVYTYNNGVKVDEKGFLVVTVSKEVIKDLTELAIKEYIQESVLVIDEKNNASLVYANKTEKLGRMKQIDEKTAKTKSAYTVRLDNLTYWVAE